MNNKFFKWIVAIALAVFVVALSLYGWSKYMSSVSGQTNSDIAIWKFEVTSNGVPISSGDIDFAYTRNDGNQSVKDGTIAPDTWGVFQIEVNTKYTEVLAEYNITIDIVDCPKNLRFYFDENYTQELPKKRIKEEQNGDDTVVTDELNISWYVPLNEHGIHTEKIYWKWPLETGETVEEINRNNEEDSSWLKKEKITMAIAVIGEQILEEPIHIVTYDYTYPGIEWNYNVIFGNWENINNENIWTCSETNENSKYPGPYFRNIHNMMTANKKYRIEFEAKSNRSINVPIYYESDKNKLSNGKVMDLTTEYKTYYLDIEYNGIGQDGGNAVTFYTKEWMIGDKLYIKNIKVSKIVTNGSTFEDLYTPTKSGYTFDGWYTAPEGGTKVTDDTRVNLSNDITIYAHWKEE